MRISVFGLGYVGTVTAACLAAIGHRVIGVDIAAEKVESINRGRAPIVERDVDQIIARSVAEGSLHATDKADKAIDESDLAVVCVGTPSSDDGRFDPRHVERVMEQIGAALPGGRKQSFLVVLRSTVMPGTTRKMVVPILERSSKRSVGDGYDVVFHPEFLREGSSVEDFYHPPKIVVGERISGAARLLKVLYDNTDAPMFFTSLESAEMIKYADNVFHAVKITFANEIGHLCKTLDIDSREVMDIFCSDRQLNISPAYLRPGFAFGGSCLPKDVKAIAHEARNRDLKLPLLESLLPSNHEQIDRAFRIVERCSPQSVGLIGLSFKPGTDDLRESPLVRLAEMILAGGYELRILDPNVETSRLVGGNLAYVERRLPHLSRLMVSSADYLKECGVIVIGHPLQEPERLDEWLGEGKQILDLAGKDSRSGHPRYFGLYW